MDKIDSYINYVRENLNNMSVSLESIKEFRDSLKKELEANSPEFDIAFGEEGKAKFKMLLDAMNICIKEKEDERKTEESKTEA